MAAIDPVYNPPAWSALSRLNQLFAQNPTYNAIYRTDFGGKLPDPIYDGSNGPLGGPAPVYDLENPQSMAALRMQLGAGNGGAMLQGARAFGGMFDPIYDTRAEQTDNERNFTLDPTLVQVANQVGFNTAPYNLSANNLGGTRFGSSGTGTLDTMWRQRSALPSNNALDLWDDLNDYTKDYYSVTGMSAGWDGTMTGQRPMNMRNNANTIYKKVGNQLLPVAQPRFGVQERTGSWVDQNRDAITGLSMLLPAFGGWAGILGQGTAGTLSAGSGLGLTTGLGSTIGTGAANALVNAGINAALTGSGSQGLLGGLLSSGIGAAGNTLMGGNGLSSLFNTANPGVSNLNPWSYWNSTLRSTGLGGSMGNATRVGQGLMNLWNRI